MSIVLVVILGVLMLGIIVWLVGQPQQGHEASNRLVHAEDEITPESINPMLKARLQSLLETNQKIDAIKLLRQETGWGLVTSKTYVDEIERHGGTTPLQGQDELHQFVSELLVQGKKIDAVKYVRQKTGLGLKEAKTYVDQIKPFTQAD